MDKAILDTDILNEVLKRRNPTVTQRAAIYMLEHGQISLSAMSRFEITRGLRHRGAVKLLISFEKFCSRSLLFPIGDAVLDRAADLWVVGRKGGYPHRDADLYYCGNGS